MDKYQVEYYENVYPLQKICDPKNPVDCKQTGPCTQERNIISYKTQRPSHARFCNDDVQLNINDTYISQNQRLAGSANPKTLIPPVITPRLCDLDQWRANNLINHSHINTEGHYDTYLSGYEVSNCCDNINSCVLPANKQNGNIIEDESHSVGDKYNSLLTTSPQHVQQIKQHQSLNNDYVVREEFEYPYNKNQYATLGDNNNINDDIRYNESGWVNTMCGYNPTQIAKSNLPSNIASGNCERQEAMKQYNKNLFTQTIQPGVYTVNEVIEPINSNMGISFTQQFEPTTCSRDEMGDLTYTEHDPRVYKPKMIPYDPDMTITESNVYDPRFNGYGTSYRSYNHKELGQTRFYYDDINSIKMPNYVVRSNIDFTNYSDTYGPLSDDNKFGNKYNSNIRQLANDTFLQSSLQQRDDLMERFMRKRNGEMWQLRKYPKHSTNQNVRSRLGPSPLI